MQPLAELLLFLLHQLVDIVNPLPEGRMREVHPRVHLIRPYLWRVVLVKLDQRLLELPPIAQPHRVLIALELEGALHDEGDEVEDGDDGRVQFIEERSAHENLLQMTNTLMRNVLPICGGSRSSGTRLSCSRRRCRGRTARCSGSSSRQKYQVEQERLQTVVVVPMPHLVAHHAADFLDVQLAEQRLVDADEVLVADAVVLGPVVVEVAAALDADLVGGEVGLEGQVLELAEQLWVGDVLEVAEEDYGVWVDLRVDDGHHEDKDLKEEVIGLSADLHHPQVAVEHRRQGQQSQDAVDNEVVEVAGQRLRYLFMLLVDYLHLVGLKRDHEGLLDEHQDQAIPQGPLELALLVDEGKDGVEVHPDEDSHIRHDEQALKARLDGKTQHLEGPNSTHTYNLSVA